MRSSLKPIWQRTHDGPDGTSIGTVEKQAIRKGRRHGSGHLTRADVSARQQGSCFRLSSTPAPCSNSLALVQSDRQQGRVHAHPDGQPSLRASVSPVSDCSRDDGPAGDLATHARSRPIRVYIGRLAGELTCSARNRWHRIDIHNIQYMMKIMIVRQSQCGGCGGYQPGARASEVH
jgi:hypothetical protein